jgi:hypothetical protein
MPEGTWVKLTPGRNPVGRSYSGICYGGGQIFYFGGGHGSHPSNDVEIFDVAAGTWKQVTEPENFNDADKWEHLTAEEAKATKLCIGGGSTSTAQSPRKRPLTHHTYQMHAWFPEEKAFYSLVRNCLWSFDPAAKEWKLITDKSPTSRDVHTWCLRYDPDLKTLVAIMGAAEQRGVWLYDAKAKTWAKKAETPAPDWTEIYSVYDASRKVHVVQSNRKWWTVDQATGQTKVIAHLADAVAKARGVKDFSSETLSLSYDPEAKAVLALVKPGAAAELWVYDAEKDSWGEVKMAGEPPKGMVCWGQMDYDPENKCHLVLNLLNAGGGGVGGRTDGLFAFRLKPGAAK